MSNFPKNEHFLHPDMHTFVCLLGGKKCSFFENWTYFVFLKCPFGDSPFCLITDEFEYAELDGAVPFLF